MRRGRALGLAAARGRAVVFVEAGDRLLPGGLAAGVEALAAHPDAAFVHGRVAGSPGSPAGNAESLRAREVHVDHYVELLRGNVVGPSCAVVFRRDALLAAGIAGAAAADLGDTALYLCLARTGSAAFHDRTVAVAARDGEGSGTTELAVLRAQRRHLDGDPRALAAWRAGVAAQVTRTAVDLSNDLRARPRGAGTLLVAVRLTALLARHPSAFAALLRSELLPFLARRHPGSRALRRLGAPATVRERHPAALVAEAVRTTLPPGAPVVVLGRPDPALDLGDRKWRFVAPVDWPRAGEPEEEFLVVPATSSWELRRTPAAGAAVAARWRPVWSGEHVSIHRRADSSPAADRVLVAGYFSFADAHATAGDLLVRDEICRWLDEAGRPYDVALAPPFVGGVDWEDVEPESYSHVVFACGPFSPALPSWRLLERFPAARTVGVNLSMLAALDDWNPFDAVIERDSSRTHRPDVAFASRAPAVPVVGVCLREQAPGTRTADAAIRRLVAAADVAVVDVDTRLDVLDGSGGGTGLRTAAEVESVIARMDVVVTTRLHGLVLALKHGVPVVAVDPGNEGFKIRRQAEAVGWPVVHEAGDLSDAALRASLAYCTTHEARALAAACGARGTAAGEQVRRELLAELAAPVPRTGG